MFKDIKQYLEQNGIDETITIGSIVDGDGVGLFSTTGLEPTFYFDDTTIEYIGLQITSIQTDKEEITMSEEILRNIIDIANSQDIKIIIIDKNDNRANAETIANETDAEIYVLNSGLTGNLDKDAYINAMKENIEILKSSN